MVCTGRTEIPGEVMSIRMNEMPCCFLAEPSVRASTKIQSACCASVVHAFWPLITHCAPSRVARVLSAARSEPAPGSEKPWHHQSSSVAMRGRKRRFCASEPKV